MILQVLYKISSVNVYPDFSFYSFCVCRKFLGNFLIFLFISIYKNFFFFLPKNMILSKMLLNDH